MKRVREPYSLLWLYWLALSILIITLIIGILWWTLWGENEINELITLLSIPLLFIAILGGALYFSMWFIRRTIYKTKIDLWKREVGLKVKISPLGIFLIKLVRPFWLFVLIVLIIIGVVVGTFIVIFFFFASSEIEGVCLFPFLLILILIKIISVISILIQGYEEIEGDREPPKFKEIDSQVLYSCRGCGNWLELVSKERPLDLECENCGKSNMLPDLKEDPRARNDHLYLLCPKCRRGLISPKPGPSRAKCLCGAEVVIDEIEFQKETKPKPWPP
jgi:ssDNA-binding Zn-finger/Zn-ribbon topoisomerase 1